MLRGPAAELEDEELLELEELEPVLDCRGPSLTFLLLRLVRSLPELPPSPVTVLMRSR